MAELAAMATDPVRGYIDGCFDIMHSGHYNAIRQAKAICDVLVVGVHSDSEIEDNKAMPVMRQPERYGLLEHIKWVDEILHDVPYSPEIATLDRARAAFCVHGDDMPINSEGVCAYDEMRDAGRLRIVKRTEGVSTTDIIGRLLTLSREHHQRPTPSSPKMGYRCSPDEAVACMPLPGAEAEGELGAPNVLETPLTSLRGLADSLASKYGMSAEDRSTLRDAIQMCAVPTRRWSDDSTRRVSDDFFAASPKVGYGCPPLQKSPEGSPITEPVRSHAPVQLLASTRRIAEFSSSNQPELTDKVVYVCGSFDMFHLGHAEFLKDARAKGTFLLVGIHDDSVVSKHKGWSLPVMSINERVLNVCACKWVDEVIICAPPVITEDLVRTWRIDIVASGVDHARTERGRQNKAKDSGRYEVSKRLGIHVDVPSKWPDLCIETIVQRIIAGRAAYMARNKDRANREDKYYEAKSKDTMAIEG